MNAKSVSSSEFAFSHLCKILGTDPHRNNTDGASGLKAMMKLFLKLPLKYGNMPKNSSTAGQEKIQLINHFHQCWGSETFLCGSGSADPYLRLMDPDPTPDPTPFFSDLKEAKKKFPHFFVLT